MIKNLKKELIFKILTLLHSNVNIEIYFLTTQKKNF